MVRKLQDSSKAEYKCLDHTIGWNKLGDGTNNPAVSDSINLFSLGGLTQGPGIDQRTGNKVKYQRITGRGTISWLAPPTIGDSALIRVILVKGKAEDNKTLTMATGANPFFERTGVLSSKWVQTKYNTKTIWDKTFSLDTAKTNIIRFKFNLKLDWFCNFQGSASTIADGGFYLGVVTNTGIIPSTVFYMDYNLSFTDA